MIWERHNLAWVKISPSSFPSRRSHAGVAVIGEKVVIVGGHYRTHDFIRFSCVTGLTFVREEDVWVFDCISEEFSKIDPILPPPKISRFSLHAFGTRVH